MRFSEDFLREIKARVRLSDVVGKSVTLKRQGREFAGLSPFNKEKSASFFVNDQKGFYHCFSSGKHGDAINFLMEVERLTFVEAVSRVAAEAGIPLPEETSAPDPVQKSRFESMLKAIDDAARFYEAELRRVRGTDGRNYLTKRGLPEPAWEQFRLGWAPQSRTALRDHLAQAGHARDILLEAGLLIAPEDGGEPYDRFRGRIMFPICDPRGRLVAFGGRTLDPNERAKYLNSPETPLFEKGRLLYRFPEARKAVGSAQNARVVIAEGYMDVIALERAGIAAVAPLGTALTEEQLALLWRIAPEPVLCFDGDAAGQRAAFRSIDRALPKIGVGRTLRFAALPDKLDPDDLIKERGAEAMIEVLNAAAPLSQMLWRRELDREPLDTPERRAGLRERLRAAIKGIADPGVRKEYGEYIRDQLNTLYGDSGPGTGEWRPGAPRQGFSRPAKVLNRQTGKWELPIKASAELKTMTSTRYIRSDRRVRDILLEAFRRPHLIIEGAELLVKLDIPDDDLDSLRDALLTHLSGEAIDLATLRHHLLERGSKSAAALLQRFSESTEEGPTDPVNAAIDDERWMRALSSAVQASEIERDAAESRASLAREVGGVGLDRHSRIAAEWRGETEQPSAPKGSPFEVAQETDFPGDRHVADRNFGDSDLDDYGFRENGLGDEGED
ncbi:MAG: DNA primase [Caulobacterales bacterium]